VPSHADNPNYKTRLCERFETEQFCPYYAKCTFAHGAAELRQRLATADQQDKPMSAVQASYQNRAKRTEATENEFLKTRLCERFMNDGECPFGPKCTYAHGREELRQRAGYQGNISGSVNNVNNGGVGSQGRPYNRDGQGEDRYNRSDAAGGLQDRPYRSQQPYQPTLSGGEDRPFRRPEVPFRSTFSENVRENREGPYRPPQSLEQERFRPQSDTTNTTGAYRVPQARLAPNQSQEDSSVSRSVLAPRATIPPTSTLTAAPAAAPPVTNVSPATTPVLGSEKTMNGRRRAQDLNVRRLCVYYCHLLLPVWHQELTCFIVASMVSGQASSQSGRDVERGHGKVSASQTRNPCGCQARLEAGSAGSIDPRSSKVFPEWTAVSRPGQETAAAAASRRDQGSDTSRNAQRINQGTTVLYFGCQFVHGDIDRNMEEGFGRQGEVAGQLCAFERGSIDVDARLGAVVC